ncbi:ATP-grasp domain-containing protein [Lunatibacter salilacus]|uniref:hypothetical protein n=1 Tax=Lunatibacter salilacus TaxID=2483804 RepID=UPI00131EA208|nr:hypothetical protein [Lunatibacter salilacus]
MANPKMEMGGLYNCSKHKQLKRIPREFTPKTIYVHKNTPFPLILARILDSNLDFPLIAKPDRGERGVGVSLVKDKSELTKYTDKAKGDFLIQEYIDTPFEAGLFYYRIPGQASGFIPSLVVKSFLKVTGDGYSSTRDLIFQIPRARMVATNLLQRSDINPDEVLPYGKIKILEPIGNHNRGTEFVDGSYLHNPELVYFFDTLSSHIPHFHYGRFDLRAPSEEDFKKGSGIKILEVNGVNAEPAHIYDPKAKFWTGVRTLLRHWEIIYTISMENEKRGFRPASFSTAWKHYKSWRIKK